MADKFAKAYEPKKHEDKIYEIWEKSGFFNPDNLNISPYDLGLDKAEFWCGIISIIVLIICQIINQKKPALELINSRPIAFRWAFYYFLIFSILIFGIYGTMTPQEFIYFQF